MKRVAYFFSVAPVAATAVVLASWPSALQAALPQGETISLSCCPVGSAPPVTRISVNTGSAPWQVSGKYLRGGYVLSPDGTTIVPTSPSPYSVRAHVTSAYVAWTANLAPAQWIQPFSDGTPVFVPGGYLDGNGREQMTVYNYTLKVNVRICASMRSATFSGQFAADDQAHAYLDFGNPVSPNPVTTPTGVSPAGFRPDQIRDFRTVVTRPGIYALRVSVANHGTVTGLALRGDVVLNCGSPAS